MRQFAEVAITRAAEQPAESSGGQQDDDSSLGFWDHSALGRAYLGEVLDAVAGEGEGAEDSLSALNVEFEDDAGAAPDVPGSAPW